MPINRVIQKIICLEFSYVIWQCSNLEKGREGDPSRLPACAQRSAELRGGILRVWNENFAVYGLRKVWRS
jgi:hypothetical protein